MQFRNAIVTSVAAFLVAGTSCSPIFTNKTYELPKRAEADKPVKKPDTIDDGYFHKFRFDEFEVYFIPQWVHDRSQNVKPYAELLINSPIQGNVSLDHVHEPYVGRMDPWLSASWLRLPCKDKEFNNAWQPHKLFNGKTLDITVAHGCSTSEFNQNWDNIMLKYGDQEYNLDREFRKGKEGKCEKLPPYYDHSVQDHPEWARCIFKI